MAARVLVIDNYDSFTYNLVQYLGELGARPVVHRNDALTVDQVGKLGAAAIVLSPGPGRPEDAGITCAVIERYAGVIPMLGVCLGHQAIGHVFGARVVGAPSLMHGKTSVVHHDDRGIFAGLPNPMTATRYHSLTLEPDTVPPTLEVTARTADGVIMAVRHRDFDAARTVAGVQFHPESILTVGGHQLLANFLGGLAASGVASGRT